MSGIAVSKYSTKKALDKSSSFIDYFPFLFRISIPVLDELVLVVVLAIEMIFWHNLQIKITTETEDTLRTDSTFCGDMAIWEQETGVLYQVVVYGG
jgi:hypothetical protein